MQWHEAPLISDANEALGHKTLTILVLKENVIPKLGCYISRVLFYVPRIFIDGCLTEEALMHQQNRLELRAKEMTFAKFIILTQH